MKSWAYLSIMNVRLNHADHIAHHLDNDRKPDPLNAKDCLAILIKSEMMRIVEIPHHKCTMSVMQQKDNIKV